MNVVTQSANYICPKCFNMIELNEYNGNDNGKSLNDIKLNVVCAKCGIPMFKCDNEIAWPIFELNRIGLKTLKSSAGNCKEVDSFDGCNRKIIASPYVVFKGELQKYHRKIKESSVWEDMLQYYIDFELRDINGSLVTTIKAKVSDISESQQWIAGWELETSIVRARSALLMYLNCLINVRTIELSTDNDKDNKEGQ